MCIASADRPLGLEKAGRVRATWAYQYSGRKERRNFYTITLQVRLSWWAECRYALLALVTWPVGRYFRVYEIIAAPLLAAALLVRRYFRHQPYPAPRSWPFDAL